VADCGTVAGVARAPARSAPYSTDLVELEVVFGAL